MQSIKNITKGLFVASFLLALAFVSAPQAKAAAYDCAYNVTEAQLPACCYPESSEPYAGVFCRADNLFLQKIGSNPPTCKTAAEVLALGTTATSKNYAGFNCFSNQVNAVCKDSTYCPLSTGCIPWVADATCTSLYKNTICGTICGECSSGYSECNGVCVATGTVAEIPSCTAKGRKSKCGGCGDCLDSVNKVVACGDSCVLKSSLFDIAPTLACPNGVDQCTGACNACENGMTPSGVDPSRKCILYSERFLEIISYGLARYGKFNTPAYDGKYDYSVTGLASLMSDVFLKSDVAETLNWASSQTPSSIQSLIFNNGNNSYITCSATKPCPTTPAGMTCSDGGLCYTLGGAIGSSCSTVGISQCNLGLVCDSTGKCADPSAGLTFCTADSTCTAINAAYRCGTDHYCHNPNNTIGTACASSAECASGLFCNNATSRVCEAIVASTIPPSLSFLGITNALYTAGFTSDPKGYQGANNICSADPKAGFSGSHVCSSDEILTLYNRKDPKILAETGSGIVKSGPPGYTANADDCRGFTVKALGGSEKVYFRYWKFTEKFGSMSECANNLIGFACCK